MQAEKSGYIAVVEQEFLQADCIMGATGTAGGFVWIAVDDFQLNVVSESGLIFSI